MMVILLGLLVAALVVGAIYYGIIRTEKSHTARCQCGRREYTLYAWKKFNKFREPYMGWCHDRAKCHRIPEEGNPAWISTSQP